MKNITLVEILVFVIIIGCVGLGGMSLCSNLSGANKEEAVSQANIWVSEVGIKNAHVNCVNTDSDGDGYVSCTVSYKDNSGELKTKAIECTGKFTINSGCRAPKFSGNSSK